MKHLSLTAITLLTLMIIGAHARTSTVWISGNGSGIYRTTFDDATGRLAPPELAAAGNAGSWIALHPRLPILYVTYRDNSIAGVASFRIENGDTLTRLGALDLDPGPPAHIAIDPRATLLATAHWGGEASTITALAPDGSFRGAALVFHHTLDKPGPGPRQDQARPHYAEFTTDGTKLHVVDLGTDEIWTFDVSADPLAQTLSHKVKLPAGYGPRHLAFHPAEPFAYVSDELGSRISAFHYDAATAVFTPLQHLDSKAVDDVEPYNNTSHVLVHPSGRFVYIGNRGHDSMGAFAIDQKTGKLTLIETEPVRGHWPRNFAIDPSGKWLLVAGQQSGTIGVMAIDPDTGALTFQRNSIINIPNPVCIQFR